jgi:hypothetical protein
MLLFCGISKKRGRLGELKWLISPKKIAIIHFTNVAHTGILSLVTYPLKMHIRLKEGSREGFGSLPRYLVQSDLVWNQIRGCLLSATLRSNLLKVAALMGLRPSLFMEPDRPFYFLQP